MIDLVLQVIVVVLGLVLVFNREGDRPDRPGELADLDGRGVRPHDRRGRACTGLEASSGLAGEVRIARRGLRRLVGARTATVLFLYVGVALVALAALPVAHGHTALGGQLSGRAAARRGLGVRPGTALPEVLRYLVGGVGARAAGDRGERGDARALAARLLARHQPPDPEPRRPPAPDARRRRWW